MWLLTRKPKRATDALIYLNDVDYISKHQAYEGILGIGATGSGKSTVLAHVMASLMQQGVGMLVLTASESDWSQIEHLATEMNRQGDLVRFAPGEPWRFDFLNWILASPGGSVAEASQVMQDLVDFSSRTDSSKSQDPFWPLAASRQCRMAITLIYHAAGCCSADDVYHFITSMPRTREEVGSPAFANSFCGNCLCEAATKAQNSDADLAADYVLKEFPGLSERTGPGITAQTMNVLEKFMHGNPHTLLASGETNVSPESLDQGKIIVVDMPVLKHREPGRFVQMVWKLLAQRHALRRTITPETRDIVLWMDEAQLHALANVDSQAQAVARKHRLIQVAITQSLPLLISTLKNKEDAFSWIGNLQTKFIFANTDNNTNQFFSQMFGQHRELMGTFTPNNKPYDMLGDVMGMDQGGSFSMSEQMQSAVKPEAFTTLRKGGVENKFLVDCYVTQGGRRFGNGKTFVKAIIRQRI